MTVKIQFNPDDSNNNRLSLSEKYGGWDPLLHHKQIGVQTEIKFPQIKRNAAKNKRTTETHLQIEEKP